MKTFTTQASLSVGIFTIIILTLPVFPFSQYWNWAILAISIGLLIVSLLAPGKSESTANQWGVLGFALIGGSATIHLVDYIIQNGQLPAQPQFLIILLTCLAFLVGSRLPWRHTPIWSLRCRLILLSLSFVTIFVLYQASQVAFNYSALTAALSYADGIGNISQIAMFASLLLVLLFRLARRDGELIIGTGMAVVLGLILSSKMLLLVAGVLGFDRLTRSFSTRRRAVSFAGLIVCASLAVLVIQPSFLAGRINLALVAMKAWDPTLLFGLGPGGYEAFINQAFLAGFAENSIGEVNHLAFNDFIQVLIELGYPGLLGLGLILASILQQQQFGVAVGIGIILGFMFPLQYIESSVLFALTVLLAGLPQQQHSDKAITELPRRRIAFTIVSMLLLGYCGQMAWSYNQWAQTDQQLDASDQPTPALQNYQTLQPYLASEDEFYLQYGLHLMKAEQTNDALRMLRYAQKMNPSYRSHIHLGDCYFRMGFYQEAVREYSEARLLRPDFLYPTYKMIYSWVNAEQSELAVAYWAEHKPEMTDLKGYSMPQMYQEIEDILKEG